MSKIKWIVFAVAAMFVCVGPGNGCASNESAFRKKPELVAGADTLRDSFVSAHLEVPIIAGKNVIWCATFQLAWNELSNLAGGDLEFVPPQDPMVAILNRRSVGAADLDESSYVATAGYVRDGIYPRVHSLMQEKFHGRFTPSVPTTAPPDARPQDILAYCFLFKQLDFPRPFERGEAPLSFNGHQVDSFGMGFYKPAHEWMAPQISILDYGSPDDFVIELKTKSPSDHLVLAKIEPKSTLAATVAEVEARVQKAKPISAAPSDLLAVPKMNFDITREYHELIGQRLIPTKAGTPGDAEILAADQNVRFLIDERGVVLQSDTHLSTGCSGPDIPMPVHRMILDKPFLLLMSRDGSKSPYFAMWIGNADLLAKAEP